MVAILEAGDSVVLIKDLKVKGSSMVAKQGTAVRRISLDHENAKYIEGKVGPTQIVIITDYVKKMAEKEKTKLRVIFYNIVLVALSVFFTYTNFSNSA